MEAGLIRAGFFMTGAQLLNAANSMAACGHSKTAPFNLIDLGGARNFGLDMELMLSIDSTDAAIERGFSDVEQTQLLLALCNYRR
ncbi:MULTISPECIES: hypothetical protein [Rhizobium]|uniref:hypothetical protein n=1 Tax=Rhizobium TaxID=379 RepID=UPI00161543CD|nr:MULTISPECIES: hypothetical protein [Rhizobium]MBB4307421.1 hypothetical protein [Rhizobium leguminosarum]MBB4415195.1 hypothetical protein [Rhizobium leguminosarum]MBB4528580.1 hypothetical protein [Rhizobium leguminosarum]MBB4539546.1 hypothetical protein [Rhizobium leguminosarum]MBB5677168.1 hypothetical protein [Rhizobium leguminosarum]